MHNDPKMSPTLFEPTSVTIVLLVLLFQVQTFVQRTVYSHEEILFYCQYDLQRIRIDITILNDIPLSKDIWDIPGKICSLYKISLAEKMYDPYTYQLFSLD